MITLSDIVLPGNYQEIALDGVAFGRLYYLPHGTEIGPYNLRMPPFTTRQRVSPNNARGLEIIELYCRAAITYTQGDRRAIQRVDAINETVRPRGRTRVKPPTKVITFRIRVDRESVIVPVIKQVIADLNVGP